jgi:hypothetical protein
MLIIRLLVLACAGAALGCGSGNTGAGASPTGATASPNPCPADAPTTDASTPGIPRPLVCGKPPGKFDVQHTQAGAFFVDERKGTGAPAVAGSNVTIKFTAYLIDGTVFDSSDQPLETTSFTLGTGAVIKGVGRGHCWHEGRRAAAHRGSP